MDNEQLNISRLNYLIKTHGEVRSEIQSRINQRDTFSIQFVVGFGAILTIGFLEFKFSPYLFFLLPLLALFYSIQILYSYTIHDRCHAFLATNVEPEIARILKYSKNDEMRIMWEEYCDEESKKIKVKAPGIRKQFFEVAIFIVPFISSLLYALLALARNLHEWWVIVLISVLAFIFFEVISMIIIIRFNRKE